MADYSSTTSTSNADILWTAAIDDRTYQFFNQFNTQLNYLDRKSTQTFNNVTNNITNNITRASTMGGRALGVLGGAVGGLVSEFVHLGAVVVKTFANIAGDTVMLAARADTLAIALSTVAGNAGYTGNEIDRLEKSVEANGITTNATRQLLLQMAGAELDLAKATDLSRVAQDAAVIAQVNSSEAATRMIHAVVSLNPLILRHLGLYVDFEEEYKKATGASGKVSAALSTQEKQIIALNAVLKAGTRIEGAYEAAMETAGKQAGSTARFMEQLQLEIGKTFQPAFYSSIMWLNNGLQEMTDYLRENKDAVEDVTNVFAAFAEFGTATVDALVDALSKVPGLVVDIEADIIQMLANLPEDEMKKRTEGIWLTFKQFLVVWVNWFSSQLQHIINFVGLLADMIVVVWKALSLLIGGLRGANLDQLRNEWFDSITAMTNDILEWQDKVQDAARGPSETMARYLGFLGESGDVADDAADRVVSSMELIAKETEDLIAKIKELNDKIGEDLAEAAIDAEREVIEEAIRNQQRLEDIARRNARRIEDIYLRHARRLAELDDEEQDDRQKAAKKAADKRAKLARDLAYELLKIEIDYGRELEDIRRHFEQDVEEAARQNDAVAVAKLIRERNRDIVDAGIERERDIEDANRDYQKDLANLKDYEAEARKERKDAAAKRKADMEKALQEELEDAERARQRDLEDMRLALERERQMKELHRQWDMEDLYRKYEDELELLGRHFASLEYIDELGLRSILENHGQYIQDDLTMWNSYYAALRTMAATYVAPTGAPRDVTDYMGTDSYTGGESYEEPDPSVWGYQHGGVGIATRRQQIVIGESEPEMIAAIPLSSIVNYNHNISMGGSLRVEGVSPSAEAELIPAIMEVLARFGKELLAQTGGMSR